MVKRGVNSGSEVERRGRQMTAGNRRVEGNQTRLAKQDIEGEGRVSRVTGGMRGAG